MKPQTMDLEDKLKHLRREREGRRRGRNVEDTWKEIDGQDGLSVKQKLERLINLTGSSFPGKRTSAGPQTPPAARDPFRFSENLIASKPATDKSRSCSVSKFPAIFWPSWAGQRIRKPRSILGPVLDLETTGLAGGTGTVPFLVGMGYYRDDRFRVAQFFLNDLAGEEG